MKSCSIVPLYWLTHVPPPSVVLIITPVPVSKSAPTAVPLFASVNETPKRSPVVPLVCWTQLAPPSVVLMINPPASDNGSVAGISERNSIIESRWSRLINPCVSAIGRS